MTKQVFGRKEMSPGISVVGDAPYAQLEIDIDLLLKRYELDDTEENRQMLIDTASSACQDGGVAITETIVGKNHKHFCPGHQANWLHVGAAKDCKLARRLHCPPCKS